MFYRCKLLKNIKGLKYLDVSNGINFSYMFYGCASLENINGLENWDVSNGTNFKSTKFFIVWPISLCLVYANF